MAEKIGLFCEEWNQAHFQNSSAHIDEVDTILLYNIISYAPMAEPTFVANSTLFP